MASTSIRSTRVPTARRISGARGDGWVLAGLAKVLQDMPKDYKHYQFFVDKFQKLAKAVAEIQQPEGLLDPFDDGS